MNLSQSLVNSLLEGFALGLAAKKYGQDNMPRLSALVEESQASLPAELRTQLLEMFATEKKALDHLDELLERYPQLDDLEEFLVDLAVLQALNRGTEEMGEDFLDSPEWLHLEEQTEDRGTELLNMLVYLRDCGIFEADPSLEDFLNEFLLVGDDEFQDEFFIYEPMIRNSELIDGALKELILLGNEIRGSEMEELFTPMMLFFREPEAVPGKVTESLLQHSALPHVHAAVFRLLSSFGAIDANEE